MKIATYAESIQVGGINRTYAQQIAENKIPVFQQQQKTYAEAIGDGTIKTYAAAIAAGDILTYADALV